MDVQINFLKMKHKYKINTIKTSEKEISDPK